MKKWQWILAILVVMAGQALAQENYTEGPVWNVSLIRVKPAQFNNYLSNLRQGAKVAYEEAKRENAIMDYKVFIKQTKNNPDDWDIAIALLFRNHAQMDGLAAKMEGVRDKVLGGKQAAQQAAEKRTEIREIVATELLQEVTLK